MNIKYFIQARAYQTASYSARDGLHELAVEAMQNDLRAIGYDDPELKEYYSIQVNKAFMAYEIPVPKAVKVLLR
jgi:hypothetical protein